MSRQQELLAQAKSWVKRNPAGYSLLESRSLEKAEREEKFSIRELCERLRWEKNHGILKGEESYAIPNALTRYIGLQIMKEHPETQEWMTTKMADLGPLASYGRRAALDLYEAYSRCDKCPTLCDVRSNVVFGGVNVSADILVVGEAPGEVEDEEGVPFVGKSGRLLMQLFDKAWLRPQEDLLSIRDEDEDDVYYESLRDFLDQHIFWTNIVCCRPPDNRTPTKDEIRTCSNRLEGLIYAVDPKITLAFGKAAASSLVGKTLAITEKRGTIYDISVTSPVTGREVRYPMMALLHPSYLLMRGDKELVSKKKGSTYETLEDLKYILQVLDTYYKEALGASYPLEKS